MFDAVAAGDDDAVVLEGAREHQREAEGIGRRDVLPAEAVDALVERSHIARWTLDPSTKPFFFSKVAHVLPAEAQRVAPTEKVAREGAE